jgi:hypothetical protein
MRIRAELIRAVAYLSLPPSLMSSTTADERTALLPPPATEPGRPASPGGDADAETNGLDPDDPLVQAGELPAKKKVTAWTVAYWVLISALVGVGTFFLVKAVRDADHVEFDFKKALNQALGGGLSGAAAMVIQVLALMVGHRVIQVVYRQ